MSGVLRPEGRVWGALRGLVGRECTLRVGGVFGLGRGRTLGSGGREARFVSYGGGHFLVQIGGDADGNLAIRLTNYLTAEGFDLFNS